MGVSENRGTPIHTPKRIEPLKGPPKQGTPIFGNPHMATGEVRATVALPSARKNPTASLGQCDQQHPKQRNSSCLSRLYLEEPEESGERSHE